MFTNDTDKDWTLTGGFDGCEEQFYDFEIYIESGLSIRTKTEASIVETSSINLEVFVRYDWYVIVPDGFLEDSFNPNEEIRIRIVDNNGLIQLEVY